MTNLPHIAGRVFNTPLLISRAKLETILGVLAPRLRGDVMPSAQSTTQCDYTVTPEGVAVIPVFGTLVRRTVGLEAASGLTSYADINQQLTAALQDYTVKAILLDIDSPGGEAGGVFDLADQIYAARKIKPIWASVDEEAFSAAYAIAAASSRIYIPRTGGVGSIGVIAVHLDQSQAENDAGLQYTAVYAGAHKNDLSPHEPLSDPARATLQAEVDRVYELFVTTVAKMRRMDPDAVKATEASLYFGDDALAAGLADKRGTYGDALSALTASITPATPRLSLPLINTKLKEKSMQEEPQTMTAAAPETPVTTTATPAATPATSVTAAAPTPPAPDIEAIRAQARAEILAYVAEVNDLCHLAGMPNTAAGFIAKAMPTAEVRKALLSAKAAASEALAIAGQIPADPTNQGEPKIDATAIYAARNSKKGA